MKTISTTCGIAVLLATGAPVLASPAFVAMRIGQTTAFSFNDVDKIGSVNAILDAKLGHDVMATGGTIKRVAPSLYMYCGYYVDRADNQGPLGFAILHNQRTNDIQVAAPLSVSEKERRCSPGERAKEDAQIEKVLRDAAR